jgi:hypothetical protein
MVFIVSITAHFSLHPFNCFVEGCICATIDLRKDFRSFFASISVIFVVNKHFSSSCTCSG